MIRIDKVLYEIRQCAAKGEAFTLAYVRSSGQSAGSVGSGTFTFLDYINTKDDEIKIKNVDDERTRTPKISHLVTFNNIPIKH